MFRNHKLTPLFKIIVSMPHGKNSENFQNCQASQEKMLAGYYFIFKAYIYIPYLAFGADRLVSPAMFLTCLQGIREQVEVDSTFH